MVNIIIILLFPFINIGLASLDAMAIKRGKRILHGVNGLVYCALLVPVWLLTHNYYLVASLLFCRLLFFNIPLNLFRELVWYYRPLKPKSIVDKIGNLIPHAQLMYIIYAASFIILTIISFL